MLPILLFAQLGTVQFHASASPDTVYVGQQVSYDAATFVDDIARTRLKANPSYTPPEVRGTTVYDFPFDTASIRDVTIASARFRKYVYHRALFPISPGTITIPPAALQYPLPQDDSYDAPLRSMTLQSEEATIVVRPLPDAGRPLDFVGAVGTYVDTARVDSATPRVGDTFVFTVRVNGVGNINLLPRPSLAIPWATVVPGEERVSWDSTGTFVRGAKEFDWVVTPKLAGEMILPDVRLPYFDPAARRYAVASTTPIKVQVEPPAHPSAATTPTTPRNDAIGDSPFPTLWLAIRENPLVVGGIVLLVILIIVGAVVLSRRNRVDE